MTGRIYTQGSSGYRVVATSASSRHRGGVALFYQNYPNFASEAIRQFGVNVIACQLAMRERHWYIVGCYLAPGDGVMIQDVDMMMIERPRGEDMVVVGYFKVDLEGTDGLVRDEDIAAAIATSGLEDLAGHFLP